MADAMRAMATRANLRRAYEAPLGGELPVGFAALLRRMQDLRPAPAPAPASGRPEDGLRGELRHRGA